MLIIHHQESYMKLRGIIAMLFAMACCITSTGWATESLRLSEAVDRSLALSPVLGAARSDLVAVTSQAKKDGMSPQFVLTGELENFAGSGAHSGFRSTETTLRLGRVIELGGKKEARRALGAAQIAQQDNAVALTRINVASRTATRFIAVLAQQKRIEILEEKVRLANSIRREVAGWVTAARNPVSDLHAAEIALADAKLALETAKSRLQMTRITLAASWGSTRADFYDVIGDLHTFPPVESFEVLAQRLPASLAMQSASLETRTLTAQRQLAISSSKPDIDLSFGVRRLEEVNDHALVMSVSIPLGSKPRATLAITGASAQMEAARMRHEAYESETYQTLFATWNELAQARQEYEAVSASMIPKAEQALAVSRKGFNTGRFSFLSLAEAQGTLFSLRMRSIDAAERYHTLLVEIERLTALPQ